MKGKKAGSKKIICMILLVIISVSILAPVDYSADEPVSSLQVSFTEDLDWIKNRYEGKGNQISIDVQGHFSYLDSSNLTITAQSSDFKAVTSEVSGTIVTFTLLSSGKSTITLSADDGQHTVTDEIELEIIQKGDATGDGILTPSDTLFVYQVINGKVTITEAQRKAMDMNGDNKITSADALLIMKAYNNLNSGSTSSGFIVNFSNHNDSPVALNILPMQTAPAGSLFKLVLPTDLFIDPDEDDNLSLMASLANGEPLPAWLAFNEETRTLEGTPVELGEVKIKIEAKDHLNESAETAVELNVISSNEAPMVVGQYKEQLVANGVPIQPLDISSLFSDPDADPLTYTVSSVDQTITKGTLAGNSLSIQPVGVGKTKIKVTANDGQISTDAYIDVHAVELVPNGLLNITTKQGVQSITVDLSTYFPPASGSVFTLINGGDASTISGKTFGLPINFGDTKSFWIISPDHKAVYLTVKVEPQSGDKIFFSEFLDAGDGRAALEIYYNGYGDPNLKAEGYEVEVHQYLTNEQRLNKFSFPLYPIWPNTVSIAIDSIFYDYFDLTTATYYNYDGYRLSGGGVIPVAFILKKNGQTIDVIGTPNGNQSTPIFTNGGTIVRKKGIFTGSTTYQPFGEWDKYPSGSYQFMGRHTP